MGDTIVMFGSARILSREQALAHLQKLRKEGKRRNTLEHRAAMRDAKAALEMSRYYEEARELSRRITSWAMSLGDHPRRFVICSGGGPGIMEAANLGAAEAGGKSIGLSIQLPHEQRPNDYISPELSFMFHYFFMRKLWFAQLAKALIIFPGGFGTMDELWEMLTLMQTGKLQRRNLILIYGRKVLGSRARLETHAALRNHQPARIRPAAICRYRGPGIRARARRPGESIIWSRTFAIVVVRTRRLEPK